MVKLDKDNINDTFKWWFIEGCIQGKDVDLISTFSVTADLIMWFLSFILIVLCIILIDFHMLNHSCIPRLNLLWSRRVILWTCCWIQVTSSLLRVFALTCIRGIGLSFSVLVVFLIWLWSRGNSALMDWAWKCSLLLNFFERISED